MNQLLKIGQELRVANSISCKTKAFIGGGGQGEVYQAELDGKAVALIQNVSGILSENFL